MNQYGLTEAEIEAAFKQAVSLDGTLDIYQTIADAATAKALRMLGELVADLAGSLRDFGATQDERWLHE